MKDSKTSGEYRKELYDYLEAEGLEITEERHDQIRYLVKMAAAVSIEDKTEQINRLLNNLLFYKEKYGELGLTKEKDGSKNTRAIESESASEPAGSGWHAPRTFG